MALLTLLDVTVGMCDAVMVLVIVGIGGYCSNVLPVKLFDAMGFTFCWRLP